MQIQKVVSKKGIEAWLVEDHSRPILSLQFAFTGGTVQDPEGKPGVATFVRACSMRALAISIPRRFKIAWKTLRRR